MKKSLLLLIIISSIFLFSCNNSNADSTKLYLSAVDAYSVRDFSKATELLILSKKAGGKQPQIDFLQGKILFFQNQYDLCIQIFNKLIKKHPEFTEARIWLIRTLIVSGQYDEAKTLLDKEIEINMTDWRVFYLYSLLSKDLNQLDEEIVMLKNAETCLEDASKVFAASALTWSILGIEEKEDEYIQKAKIIGNIEDVNYE
jgi:tetratricopeptide (TPR) repeat protein